MEKHAGGKDIVVIVREMRKHVGEKVVVRNEDPFRVLIATVLSQRTRDANTRRATEQLFSKYSTPKQLANARLRSIEKLIRPAGFYRQKACRIKEIAGELVRNFNGEVPRGREQLMGLPGVGSKTAGCVLVYGFNEDALPVDVHVHRISNRIGLVNTKQPEETEQALMQVVPRKYWKEINHLMVRFGQQVCLSRNPRHGACNLRAMCNYYRGKITSKR